MALRLFVASFLLLSTLCVYAQRVEKVRAEYTYHAPENATLEEAKRTALDRAKIQAIADEFGTLVSQSNTTFLSNVNGESSSTFFSLGGSDVKGEWIETIGEPVYEIDYDQGMLVVSVLVEGRIREIVSSTIDLDVKVLRNGREDKFESDKFRSGDDLFLSFKSPVDGFLAIYLIDEQTKDAYCLLPYSQSDDAVQTIEHDKPYLFFSSKDVPHEMANMVDELTMTCSRDMEINDIFVIFSPNAFAKANSNVVSDNLPRQLSWEDFSEWLTRLRKRDHEMQCISKKLIITR